MGLFPVRFPIDCKVYEIKKACGPRVAPILTSKNFAISASESERLVRFRLGFSQTRSRASALDPTASDPRWAWYVNQSCSIDLDSILRNAANRYKS